MLEKVWVEGLGRESNGGVFWVKMMMLVLDNGVYNVKIGYSYENVL